MNIELDISLQNEGTAAPWWVILDPKQNMTCDIYVLANMITGPFFSRDEADMVLKERRHHYSDRAVVFCMSGCYTHQYAPKYKRMENDHAFMQQVMDGFLTLFGVGEVKPNAVSHVRVVQEPEKAPHMVEEYEPPTEIV